MTLVLRGRPFEVTTLREDIETDGRRAVVRFGRSFAADALRRDFTVNALSLDRAGRVHDTVGGLADLAARRLRFIGDPKLRIKEDYLRILRFFRFHASYATGPLDAEGFAAAIGLREGLRLLSAERVRDELLKLIKAPGAAATAQEMLAGGFWPLILGGVPHVSRFKAASERNGIVSRDGAAPWHVSRRLPCSRARMRRACASACASRMREAGSLAAIAGVARTAAWYPVARAPTPKRSGRLRGWCSITASESVRIAACDRGGGVGKRQASPSSRGSRARSRRSRSPAPIFSSAASRRVRRWGAFWRKRARTGSTRVARSRSRLWPSIL